MSVIGLQSTQSLSEAGRKVFAHHFHDFLKHEVGVCESEDIEAVHDMRVSARRLRAAIQIFEAGFPHGELEFFQKGLKQTARLLGVVRDLDVFIEKLTIYQQKLPFSEQAGLAPLFEYCHLQRDFARAKLLAHLDSGAYKKFKMKTVSFLKKENRAIHYTFLVKPMPHQIKHVVPTLIYGCYEAIRAYEPFLIDAPIELLHQLRIDFKHFRYALESFHEILGNDSELVLAEVKQMQDHLGDLNDAGIGCQFLADFLQHWKQYRKQLATTRSKKPSAIVDYLNFKIAEKDSLLATFPSAWHHFNSNKLRRNLALAIAVL